MATDITPLQIALAVTGWLGSVGTSYWLGTRRSASDRYYTAAAAFRSAVNTAIAQLPRRGSRLEHLPMLSSNEIDHFGVALQALTIAVENFRPYVPKAEAENFRLAWAHLSTTCEGASIAHERGQRSTRAYDKHAIDRAEAVEHAAALLRFAPEKR